jgi:cellulose synthase operon protein C
VPHEVTPASGTIDGVSYEGRATLRSDGSAVVDLVQSFSGKVGITMRNVIDKVPAAQLHDFVESRLLGRSLPGSRLHDVRVENADDLGAPLRLRLTAETSQLARLEGKGLTLKALFPVHLAQLAALPLRQTPLLLTSSSHVDVRFEVVVPESMRMPANLPQVDVHDGERTVHVGDMVAGHAIVLTRAVDIPAGRVQPGEPYTRFQRFVQEADAALEREVVIGATSSVGSRSPL